MTAPGDTVAIRSLGTQPFVAVWTAMRDFTRERDAEVADELWWLEHHSVYTLGQAGKREHLLNPGNIPVVATDRGGQVTWHGPGQWVCYLLVDLKRRGLGVRALVDVIEQSLVAALGEFGIAAHGKPGAPGVYVGEGVAEAKIGALGLRVSRGCSYHGLSLNVAPDLAPFAGINPCGFADLPVTSMAALGAEQDMATVRMAVQRQLVSRLGYTRVLEMPGAGLPAPAANALDEDSR